MKKFTLIELLVVVAIIGILASIMMPSLQNAREKAKSAVCLSNLKQLSMFVEVHKTDFEVFPPDADDSSGSILTVKAVLENYSQEEAEGNWLCPSASNVRNSGTAWNGTETDYSQLIRINQFPGIFARQSWGWHADNLSASSISNPSKVMLFFDAFRNSDPRDGTWHTPWELLDFRNVGFMAAPTGGLATRHGGTVGSAKGSLNSVQADGSAKTTRYSTFNGMSQDDRRYWTDAVYDN